MGLVPLAAKPGDIIVCCWDCDAAIVMRPTKTLSADPGVSQLYNLIGRANVADVYDRSSTQGYDLRAEQCMLGSTAPGFIEDASGYFGAVYVNFDLHTLQMITAYITT
ncbi:hypothetical protein F5Y03DRAFT_370818 [Xylaria venustula]|nr:hypothetical protein F5Y03DRAFT_370818 [Xylaria venustula]